MEVYSQGTTVELFVNGISKGKKKLEQCRAVFDTSYETGTVKAVVYDESGGVYGESTLSSAVGEIGISIEPETEALTGRLLYVNINLCGENGVIEGACDEQLSVQVSGGKLLGYGSAAPRTEENFLSGTYTTYNGRSQAVILVESGNQLEITAVGKSHSVKRLLEIKTPNY